MYQKSIASKLISVIILVFIFINILEVETLGLQFNSNEILDNVIIAVIDSKVDVHHDLIKDICLSPVSFLLDKSDEKSHGTSVTSAVYLSASNIATKYFGDSSNVQILPIEINIKDIQNDYGNKVSEAIMYAVDEGAKVINMSFSSYSSSTKIYEAIEYGLKKGVVFVSAAGNSGVQSYSFPASYEGVISVASCFLDNTNTYKLSKFSNYNDMVDIAVSGERLMLADDINKYAVKTGTSYSSAIVAGIIGELIYRYDELKPRYVAAAIVDSALNIDTYKFGALNIEAAIEYLDKVKQNNKSPLAYKSKENNKYKRLYTKLYGVSAGKSHVAFLNSDKTVKIEGDTSSYRANVVLWSNVKKVYAGFNNTIAIDSYNKPIATGHNLFNKNKFWNWLDVADISSSYNFTAGLTSDGKVLATDYLIKKSKGNLVNIKQIASGAFHLVALDDDNKINFVGCDMYDQSESLSLLDDITYIASNTTNTACITKDKRVVVVGDNLYGQCETESWKNVISVGVGNGFIIGLKSNGTLVAIGRNINGVCEVENLKDIVYISVADDYFIAIDINGSIVHQGGKNEEN